MVEGGEGRRGEGGGEGVRGGGGGGKRGEERGGEAEGRRKIAERTFSFDAHNANYHNVTCSSCLLSEKGGLLCQSVMLWHSRYQRHYNTGTPPKLTLQQEIP